MHRVQFRLTYNRNCCNINPVQPLRLLKTIEIQDVDKQQTLLIFPADYVSRFTLQHVVTFEELAPDAMLVRMVGLHAQAFARPYKLVTCKGAVWCSVPRVWLRNVAAREGDRIDLFSTADPDVLVVKYRAVRPY